MTLVLFPRRTNASRIRSEGSAGNYCQANPSCMLSHEVRRRKSPKSLAAPHIFSSHQRKPVVVPFARNGRSKPQSSPRKRESTPQTFRNALSTDWIPAFAGMTGVRRNPGRASRPMIQYRPQSSWRKELIVAKVLRCRDLGMNCSKEIRAQTEVELLKLAAEHAEKDHGFPVSMIPPSILAMVKASIKDE